MNDTLDEILFQMGTVGKRLTDLGMAEGAAGNISVCLRDRLKVYDFFPEVRPISWPMNIPELAGSMILISGSGRRLREIYGAPKENIACVTVGEGGRTGQLFISPEARFERITSEFNSHLAVHHDRMKLGKISFHAVVHAQPTHLTYLSHIPAYQDETYFNQHLFRWQPETILNIPRGIGVLPFIVNGSDEQMLETARSMRDHPLVVWSRHGVLARSDHSMLHALDLIEYAEAAAHYETLNLSVGENADGLSPDQVREICRVWGIDQTVY